MESDHDLEQYGELLRLVFPGEGVDVLGRRLYEHHPEMTARNFFAIWEGDQMIATLNLIPQIWSLDGVHMRVAEMGLVGTHPDYRGRGLQRVLNAEFDRRVREDGYHLAGLEGIPYFYRQFGYEYSVPLDECTSIPLQRLPTSNTLDISTIKFKEIPDAMRILETSQKRYLVHSVRSFNEWEAQEKEGVVGEHESTTYIVRRNGEFQAYFRVGIEGRQMLLHEIAGIDLDMAPEITAFLRRLGQDKGVEELVSREAYIEPFDKFLFSLGASKKRIYAWQMKVVDYTRVFERLKTLFETRIKASPYNGYSGDITLDFYNVAVSLSFEGGKFRGLVHKAPLKRRDILINPRVFPKLLLGFRSLDELEAEYPDVLVKQEYKQIVKTLFPKGEGHIHTTY